MSDKPKHTPGPWIAIPDARVMTTTGKERRVAECYAPGTKYDDIEDADGYFEAAQANARLVAAAPDLLEAGQAIVKYHEDHDPHCGCGINKMIAAIEKATKPKQ